MENLVFIIKPYNLYLNIFSMVSGGLRLISMEPYYFTWSINSVVENVLVLHQLL
jgi:hypothetical protein